MLNHGLDPQLYYTENDSKVGNLARRLRKFFVWSERPLCEHKARVKTKNLLHSQRSQKPTFESFSVYYRDVQKNEVDVVFKSGANLIPIEIKSSKTYNNEFLKKLHFFQNLAGDLAPKGYLIYAGEQQQDIHGISLLNYRRALLAVSS